MRKAFWDAHNNPQKLSTPLCREADVALVGSAYPNLDELSRMILIMAHRFGEVRNQDLQPHRGEHPRDIDIRLGQLAASGWLNKEGHGRGTRYRWPVRAPQDLLSPVTDEPFQAATGEVAKEVKAVLAELNGEMTRTQLQGRLKLAHEDHFRKAYLLPAIRAGLVTMTIPDKPKSRLQKYKLTAAGKLARAQIEPRNKM